LKYNDQKQSQAFHFQLVKPSGKLSTFVKDIWVASVSQHEQAPIIKPLYPDAASGLIFNLRNTISIDEQPFSQGIIALPVSKKASVINMPPNTLLAGIRFHPAMAYGVFGKHYQEPTNIHPNDLKSWQLHTTFHTMMQQQNIQHYTNIILHWAETLIDCVHVIPTPIEKAFSAIACFEKIDHFAEISDVSQRHIERLFHTWLDMTPKHFQRVIRIHHAIQCLRENPYTDLADIAAHFKFSDQAHMTRECRAFTDTTPKRIRQLKMRHL
jgi:AraC-like DNA-binding protein